MLPQPLLPPEAPRSRRLAFRGLALLLGPDHAPALRPLFVLRLLSTIAFAGFWTYLGIWAIQQLGASPATVGTIFLANAVVWTVFSWLGGLLSDRIGRKPVLVVGTLGQALCLFALAPVGHNVLLGVGIVMASSVFNAPAQAATNALVADLVPEEQQEEAYAGTRVASNLGAALGPPLAAGMLALGGWGAVMAGAAALGVGSAVFAYRMLPAIALPAHARPERTLRTVLADSPFMLLLVSALLASSVYVAYETVLPVVAVSSYALPASLWGLLLVINPLLVTLFQLRLTSAVARYSAGRRLVVAMALMGGPFLLLLWDTSVPTLIVVLIVFVVGEMLWAPTSQAIAARLAPAPLRGAYMGAYGVSSSVSFMLAPFGFLHLRAHAGDGTMWLAVGGVALVAAVAGVVAARAAD
ncbi:MAG: hypothetical protein QOE29_2210 [Gaiellaceae bacterium]|nr:hypothetical protein [Gaiellaceae bacterium]